MDILQSRVGSAITCLYMLNGKMEGTRGILTYADNQFIVVNGRKISYVDDNMAIYAIYEGENTVLYLNEIVLSMTQTSQVSYNTPNAPQTPEHEVVTDNNKAVTEPEATNKPVARPSKEEIEAMFKKLLDNLCATVRATYVYKGEVKELFGKLDAVVDYDLVTIDSTILHFIDPYVGIIEIIGLDGKVFYHNEKAREYTGCKNEDLFALMNAQEEYLGKSIIREELMNKPRS